VPDIFSIVPRKGIGPMEVCQHMDAWHACRGWLTRLCHGCYCRWVICERTLV